MAMQWPRDHWDPPGFHNPAGLRIPVGPSPRGSLHRGGLHLWGNAGRGSWGNGGPELALGRATNRTCTRPAQT